MSADFDLKGRVIEAILDGGDQYTADQRQAKIEEAERKINRMTNVELLEAISDTIDYARRTGDLL